MQKKATNKIFIDASNIGSGGGLNHLAGILRNFPKTFHDKENYCDVYCKNSLIKKLPKHTRIKYKTSILFFLPSSLRLFWNIVNFRLICLLRAPDILLCPGGILLFRHKESTVIFQNVLPYVDEEIKKYPLKRRVKWLVLRKLQIYSSFKSKRHIFPTQHSRDVISPYIDKDKKYSVINHGIEKKYINSLLGIEERLNVLEKKILNKESLDFIYVASAEMYKNHKALIEAFEYLDKKRWSFHLELVLSDGSSYKEITDFVKQSAIYEKITLSLNLGHQSLIDRLHRHSNIFIFASSCESFGLILLEGMASGMPVYSVKASCIPEILGEKGFYFDIDDPKSLYLALKATFFDLDSLKKIPYGSWDESKKYSWEKCAKETWSTVFEG
jgi:glycosyltransferase involved in cell wall biosynthesis